MRLPFVFWSGLSLSALLLSASAASLHEEIEPEILVEARFPESNPFGHVVNGERNQIYLIVENKSDQNVTLASVSGSFHNPDTNALIKNISTLTYGTRLLEGTKLQVPFTFYSEFKPGNLRLNLWLEHKADSDDYKHRVTAYDSIVTIVEPEMSIFDYKLISTYLIVLALIGGGSYYAYTTYVPSAKKTRRKPARTRTIASDVSAPVGTVTAKSAGGYEEEWIPEHHLKKPKSSKRRGVVSSGDELSGGETSPTEGKKRKGKK